MSAHSERQKNHGGPRATLVRCDAWCKSDSAEPLAVRRRHRAAVSGREPALLAEPLARPRSLVRTSAIVRRASGRWIGSRPDRDDGGVDPRSAVARCRSNPSVAGLILERKFQFDAVGFHFPVGDVDVLLYDIGDAKVPQGFSRSLDGCTRRFLPGLAARPDQLDALVDTLCHLFLPPRKPQTRNERL